MKMTLLRHDGYQFLLLTTAYKLHVRNNDIAAEIGLEINFGKVLLSILIQELRDQSVSAILLLMIIFLSSVIFLSPALITLRPLHFYVNDFFTASRNNCAEERATIP